MAIPIRDLSDKELNPFERRLLKNIEKYGWHANGIPGESTSPNWAYSVGIFAKYNQPELIVFGLEIELMHQMIAAYFEQAKSGMQFKDRVKAEGILANQTCTLREVHLPWRESLLRSASWYYHYQEYPVLQCFWPDKQGCFPWDTHFSKSWRKLQPLLYESEVEKTGLPKSMLIDA